ncbi:hypothetical protein BDW02DRAFT_631578 [Decorospora gaudefroyi]|uniref:Uncharacterized protein n=1 Tax=Decorospora gaudefroyi TaxID=184978 RepID=A0A6A5K9F7_9PLEO|nr:hypothetical protein BDW02DRAFT_631578 [Decorospora gaudefroyi]
MASSPGKMSGITNNHVVRQPEPRESPVSKADTESSAYDRCSTDLMYRADGGYLAEQPTQTPVNGDARALATMSRSAIEDIQGYLMDQYKAAEKVGHEWIEPTGTKTVFFLQQKDTQDQEPDSLDSATKLDMETYINGEDEDEGDISAFHCDTVASVTRSFDVTNSSVGGLTILPTIEEVDEKEAGNPASQATSRKARLRRSEATLSLAGIIERADLSGFVVCDSDSNSEDGIEGICKSIELKLPTLAEGEQDVQSGVSPITPPNAQHFPSISPPQAIDIPAPRSPSQKSGLRCHSGSESLASLIARADDASPPSSPPSLSSSPPPCPSPTTSSFGRGPCYDPYFTGHTPCATQDDRVVGRSADEAVDMLNRRFKIVHSGVDMVLGSSGLRSVVYAYEDEFGREVAVGDDTTNSVIVDGDESEFEASSSVDENVVDTPVLGIELDVSGLLEEGDEDPHLYEAQVVRFVPELDILPLQTPPTQIVPENEVLYDYDSSFNSVVAPWMEHGRLDRVAEGAHRRMEMFDNVLREPVVESSPVEISPSELPNAAPRVHTTASKDTLKKTSFHSSVFSNGTSVTSNSSYNTNRPMSARDDYSRLMDALDLEIEAHKCEEGCDVCASTMRGCSVVSIGPANKRSRNISDGIARDGRRIVSLPVVPSEQVRSGLRLGDADNDSAAAIAAVNGVDLHHSPERMRRILAVPDTPERIGREIDDFLNYMSMEKGTNDDEVEGVALPCVPLPTVKQEAEETANIFAVPHSRGAAPTRKRTRPRPKTTPLRTSHSMTRTGSHPPTPLNNRTVVVGLKR